MTLHSLMMSQANFFLQFKSVVNKSAELKIVTWPKSNFRLTWAPKVGLGPPNWGVWGAAATSLCINIIATHNDFVEKSSGQRKKEKLMFSLINSQKWYLS